MRYPRHGDRQHTRDSCSTRSASTDGTLLRIRPTAGSCWANQGKPDRLPATYGRIHGVTYFHGCYSGGDDRLWGVNRRRKGTANTLAALKSIRAALLGEEEQSRAVFHPDVRPIEAHFGPLRQFTLANSHHPSHPAQTRYLHADLRWRNTNARHPDVLAAQRKNAPAPPAIRASAGADAPSHPQP